MRKYFFEIFADYFQIICQDESAEITSFDWNAQALEKQLITGEKYFVFSTARNMDVPVEVEIYEETPILEEDNFWQKKITTTIHLASGKLMVHNFEYLPDVERIELPAGNYDVQILLGGLDTISEGGLDGEDRYKIILSPAKTE